MHKLIKLMAILVGYVFVNCSMAAQPLPHTFSNGQPADADQVNENFEELANRVESVSTQDVRTYNFQDYLHNFDAKVFKVKAFENGEFVDQFTETRSYDRSVAGFVSVTRESQSANEPLPVLSRVRKFKISPGESLSLVEQKRFEYEAENVPVLMATASYNPPLQKHLAHMGLGHTWGGVSELTVEYDPDYVMKYPGTPTPPIGFRRETWTLLGTDATITVPSGSYNDCIRLQLITGGISGSRIDWYCKGVGLVKSYAQSEISISIRELISTSTGE